ncbi:nidogen-2 isoform X1 [Archocentrus centrarchus]|uniref:nidogen-2 isoform X1 n=1 Tax=Archocentrus centrarchus TaxID=63155 RepID=UPI0011EA4F8C|nr:nidogen-2 isoform X1 [Archocentrus centrarchus]
MDRGAMLAACVLLCCSCTAVTAIQRADMFPYGTSNGDSVLGEGDDETSKVLSLPKPLYFYNSPFSQLYVATNGIISAHDLPMEKQYVDDGLPTDFPVVAPFLADIDTSGGRGQIYYRATETPSVLNRITQEVQQGFPDAKFTPTHAVVATWENVPAYEEQTRPPSPPNKVNTFQAVIGYDEADSYVLFLYPEGGLNFFGTRPKESYNVEIELPARVGFSRGEIVYFFISRTEGPYYSLTTDEQSVKNLYQVGNTGVPGLWLFHTGNRYSFDNIVPASIRGLPVTPPPAGYDSYMETTTPEYDEFEDYEENPFDPKTQEGEDDYPLTGKNPEFQPAPAGGDQSISLLPRSSDGSDNILLTSEPGYGLEPADRHYTPPNPAQTVPEEGAQQPQEQQPHVSLKNKPPLEVVNVHSPHRNAPPLSPGVHVVSVDEEVNLDTGVIQYTTENKETCARFQQQCSQNAFCSDYATGFCCHCRPGFYGNGRQCLPDGAPQRVSGKVSGTVSVGSTPVSLNNIDLHAYIVVGDGRAYTAISEVPEPLGWALMPVAPIGELFGWLFALELFDSQAGFKITGAEFTRHAEVVFHPGNQRLSIIQTGRGLDDHNHLTVDTVVSGSVPFLPPGAEVNMDPFKETYQYYPSVATSTSVREYSVVTADRGSESVSFQLKQNITYRDCRHSNQATSIETLQILMDRVFVMYVKEERILRYAITNKISPVGVDPPGPELFNPCYAGTHDCDTTAQCIPSEGQAFQCQCATGYTGDGHNCYDMDECAEGLSTCGDHSECVNLAGSYRCQCQSGYEFGYDERTCVDINECSSSPCHISARCINEEGSFQCQCQPGFYGNGFYCSQQEERPKTHCEHHRDRVTTTSPDGYPIVGAYVPQCDAEGQYIPQQCHGSTGYCWCVDNRGEERAGTRTSPGAERIDCNRPERPKTHCEHHRDRVTTTSPDGYPIVGAYVPQCDAEGQYLPQQCHGSTGYCWCVDSRGEERAGTRTPPGAESINCDRPERPKTHCEHHRDRVTTTSPDGYPIVGAYVPQCDAEGQYLPVQCHGSTGYCWCVDNRGEERAGTRTPPGEESINCDRPERPKTHCEHHRDRVTTTSPDGYPIAGAYVPQCDAEGQYLPQQCHGSTGYCWCVDSRGEERAGTRTPPGAESINCDRPERPKTHCEHHRDRVTTTSPDGYPIAGAYVPQCDAEGQYLPQQCHDSTGYCWCVDSRGEERAGTRTPPGAESINCDRPERPKTHCEHHRDRVTTTSPDGYPIAGAYVPQCDAEGQYLPQQCHGSTGYCWCVDSRGEERAGTRTPPGAESINCDRPVPVTPTQRPESMCERWRASLIEHYGGKPGPQQYVPQCEPDGEFSPVQCYGETTYCWCVDQNGHMVPGTKSSDAVKPACISSVAPPTVRPLPRPDVTPPTNTDVTLLYAQGQKIGALPLNGTRLDGSRAKTLLTLHGSIVVGIAYDCKENKVYWTDLSARTINRASVVSGAEAEILINTNLVSPEGLAVDVKRRLMFWVDSSPDVIERANLDGSGRRTLFDTDLVNPRAIIVVSSTGTLYWTDWNREAPKIESSSVDGQNRQVVVSDGIGLPNALTYDSSSGQICWADAGTKRLECMSLDGSGRRVIHTNLNYPFSMIYYRNHFYYTDWRRDGVIAVGKDSSQFTDEYLPEQRSHLYGITIATTHCLPGSH